MTLEPGQTLNNRYRIVSLLGKGGFGAVYRVWDINMETPRALKENLDTTPEAQRQFKREAKMLGELVHPNLPRVIDHFIIPEQGQYLVMDFVEGEDLQQTLERVGGPLPEPQVLTWIMQICDALQYLHTRNPPIIHRDIKPANIKITPDGKAMLVDFGIAKVFDEHLKTTVGARAVTPGYAPVEQYGRGMTDARSDLYALGATLYTLLTGETPMEATQRAISDSLPLTRELNPDIDPLTEAAVSKAMRIDPERRFQTSQDFKSALARQAVEAIQPSREPVSRSVQAPARKPPRPLPWVWIGGVGIIGVILVVVVLLLVSSGDRLAALFQSEPTASRTLPATATRQQPTTPPQQEAFECTDPIGCVDIPPDEPVHIVYMLSLSGDTAHLGEDSLGGIEIAIGDRGSRLLNHEILVTGEDSRCSASGGQAAAIRVAANPSVLGVIGTTCSTSMTAAMDTLSNAGLVILSPSNTAPSLTFPDQTHRPGYFRVANTDLYQGALAAEFSYNELGSRRAVTIQDGSPYADQLQEVFSDRFQALGGTVIFQGAVKLGDNYMRPVLASAAANSPDILYFPLFEPEGPLIVAQSAEFADLENTVLMGADALLVESFPENAGARAIGIFLSGPYVSGPQYEEFLAKWETRFGSEPPAGFHAFAYDATNILLEAIQAVTVQDPDGTLHVPRQALRLWIENLTGFPGLTGRLDCREKDFGQLGRTQGDCATTESLGIYQITEAEVNEDHWPPPVIFTP